MSPQTTVVFFLGVLVAFCYGLEFEERGEFEVKLVVKFERALAMFDSVFSSCRMLRGADNSTIPMICTSVRNTCFLDRSIFFTCGKQFI